MCLFDKGGKGKCSIVELPMDNGMEERGSRRGALRATKEIKESKAMAKEPRRASPRDPRPWSKSQEGLN